MWICMNGDGKGVGISGSVGIGDKCENWCG